MDMEKINEHLLLEGDSKPVKKLKDLSINTPYKISIAKLVKSKFGEAVLLELNEWVVFLPTRSTVVLKDHLTELGNGKYSIVYIGEKDTGKGNPASLFKFVNSKF